MNWTAGHSIGIVVRLGRAAEPEHVSIEALGPANAALRTPCRNLTNAPLFHAFMGVIEGAFGNWDDWRRVGPDFDRFLLRVYRAGGGGSFATRMVATEERRVHCADRGWEHHGCPRPHHPGYLAEEPSGEHFDDGHGQARKRRRDRMDLCQPQDRRRSLPRDQRPDPAGQRHHGDRRFELPRRHTDRPALHGIYGVCRAGGWTDQDRRRPRQSIEDGRSPPWWRD